jgi:hypothetical protein
LRGKVVFWGLSGQSRRRHRGCDLGCRNAHICVSDAAKSFLVKLVQKRGKISKMLPAGRERPVSRWFRAAITIFFAQGLAGRRALPI